MSVTRTLRSSLRAIVSGQGEHSVASSPTAAPSHLPLGFSGNNTIYVSSLLGSVAVGEHLEQLKGERVVTWPSLSSLAAD